MQKVVILEYVGQESLEFDLYNSFREKIYEKGTPLTPSMVLKFSTVAVYRDENEGELVSSVSRAKYKTYDDSLTSVYSHEIAEYLVSNAKKVIEQVEKGEIPDKSVCEATRNIIIDEISSKIDEVESIHQLRIVDDYTFSHGVNVASICSALAFKFDFQQKEIEDLTLAAFLHDIGKTRIPPEILQKPKPLVPSELEIMKQHTIYGYDIIKNQMGLPERIALVALEHQEKYNGTGYPRGIKGKEISLFSQIASIADVYDALVSQRVYKEPMTSSDAIKIMIAEGSKSFNPFVLYKFIYLVNYKSSDGIVEDPQIIGFSEDTEHEGAESATKIDSNLLD
ncbi:MAG: HD-GYP domain-containing protein [Candidatus Gastranaerophilales bacterium]|nr:HD-GYP domain-containing protein [Candidatus Gastranaerophilales bacterium]